MAGTDDHHCPCETCIDWRVQQSANMASFFTTLVRATLTDLGIDPEDKRVQAIMGEHIAKANPTA